MKLIYKLAIIPVFLLLSCGKTEPVSIGQDPDPVPNPLAAILVFPDNNTECNEGNVLNETQSSVTFRWNASQNTDTYELNLRNLNNNNITQINASTNEATATLLRGTPYEWFVVSMANGTEVTASSETWKFYNQGPGIENYTPFPAEVISPLRGSIVTSSGGIITLEWTGSDVDNDITEFDILFGTETTPSTLLGTTSDNSIDATVVSGEIYYWRVITKDSEQNSSDSEIFDFRVN
ncbi:MAG: hypothetical protein KJO39_06895 [Bacteroidia bacterium]|nr:hypothetical protein [Bacteroidia bacterium]NNL81356.1 hypothetical protein [Flavobacteriaceae bacterium]